MTYSDLEPNIDPLFYRVSPYSTHSTVLAVLLSVLQDKSSIRLFPYQCFCSSGRIRTCVGTYAHQINSLDYSASIATEEFISYSRFLRLSLRFSTLDKTNH